jgi:hypothetical protein
MIAVGYWLGHASHDEQKKKILTFFPVQDSQSPVPVST